MTKKKEELTMGAEKAAENKKAEGEKKYARLPDKVVSALPAAAILLANEKSWTCSPGARSGAAWTRRR